jgi:hypothetical protein
MYQKLKLFTIVLTILTQVSCTISRRVEPVDSGTSITKVYVKENKRVHMEGLIDEILKQIEEIGIESESYEGDRPIDARHYMTFTANWAWDMAMYMTYFKATIYEDGRILGEVEYDAKRGGGNMNKFGKTANKIRPLLQELLGKVNTHPKNQMGE